jgi:D-aminoacyl-tRNA deacylase
MKLVIQRVANAQVEVDEKIVGKINKGYLVLFGVKEGDTIEQADALADKLCKLRIFEDENEKMNLSINDIDGELLIVSQFTLYANCEKGNRPSFVEAMEPKKANEIYEYFVEKCKEKVRKVEKGVFGAHMRVSLLNDGPVTIVLEK